MVFKAGREAVSLYLLVALPILLLVFYDWLASTGDLSAFPAMRLCLASRLESGVSPYSGFFTFDSPLTLYLGALPAFASKAFIAMGLPLTVVSSFKVLLGLLICLSLSACISIVYGARKLEGELPLQQSEGTSLSATCAALAPAFLLSQYLVRFQWGDEQHLFLLFFCPYLFMRWLSCAGIRYSGFLSFISAFFAGLAAGLDIVFLPLVLGHEILVQWRTKKVSFDSACLGLVVGFLLSLALFAFLPEVAKERFLQFVLPLRVMKLGLFDDAMTNISCAPDLRYQLIFFAVAMLVGLLSLRKNILLAPFIYLACAGLILYAAEMRGLSSDLVITLFASGMTLIISGFTYVRILLHKPMAVTIISVILFFASGSLFISSRRAIDDSLSLPAVLRRNADPDLAEVLSNETKPGQQVLIVSHFPEAAYPSLLYYDRKQAGYLTYGEPLHLLLSLRTNAPTRVFAENGVKFLAEMIRKDLESDKIKLMLIHLNHEVEDLKTIGLAYFLDVKYTEFGKAYYYTRNRVPKESNGLRLPFIIYRLDGKLDEVSR
jgi:hypothetical protein